MRKIFSLFFVCLLALPVWAQQQTLRIVNCDLRGETSEERAGNYARLDAIAVEAGADVLFLQSVADTAVYDLCREAGACMQGYRIFMPPFPEAGVGVMSRAEAVDCEAVMLPGGDGRSLLLAVEFEDYVFLGVRMPEGDEAQRAVLPAVAEVAARYAKPVFVSMTLEALPDSPTGKALEKDFTLLSYYDGAKEAGRVHYVLGYTGKGAPYAVKGNWLMSSPEEALCPQMLEAVLATPAEGIFRTEPYLQSPVEGGITVSWLTRVPVYSWVEYGTDTLRLSTVRTLVDGQALCNNLIHKIRLSGLEGGKTYYYRVCSREILAYGAYSKTFGNTARSEFHTFRLPEEDETDFTALIFNDVHKQFKTIDALYEQVKDCGYDFVIFNGDVIDDPANEREAVEVLVHYNETVGAADVPVFYLRGNHEIRNAYSIGLRDLLEYVHGKTYGAFNWGDTRFVMLDCGEDKPDDHWVYYGLNDFSGLREEQAGFLEEELKSKPFRRAAKRVLVHHIPLYGNDYDYNPCLELWGVMLEKAPFNVSLNAHTHVYAYHPKGSLGNNYPVFIGGGYDVDDATVMVLTKRGDVLKLKVVDAQGEVLKEMEL